MNPVFDTPMFKEQAVKEQNNNWMKTTIKRIYSSILFALFTFDSFIAHSIFNLFGRPLEPVGQPSASRNVL